jgi:hypothetical protein
MEALAIASSAGALLPAIARNPLVEALGCAALHVNRGRRGSRTIINRLGLHISRSWRRWRRRSPVNRGRCIHRRLRGSSSNSCAYGKTSQSAEGNSRAGGQAITRRSRLARGKAGDQRQSRGRAGNNTEDPHDHHLRHEGDYVPPSSWVSYTVQNLSES